jgi:hypothetical protein
VSIDHSDAVGFPAPDAGRVRSLPIALSGTPQPGKASRNAKPVAAEYGWLTPLRKSKGDPALWFFRCRCGKEFVRLLGGVRRDEREGRVAKCAKGCEWQPAHPVNAICVCSACVKARGQASATCARCGRQECGVAEAGDECEGALLPAIVECREAELLALRSLLRSVTGKLEEARELMGEDGRAPLDIAEKDRIAALIDSVLEVLS